MSTGIVYASGIEDDYDGEIDLTAMDEDSIEKLLVSSMTGMRIPSSVYKSSVNIESDCGFPIEIWLVILSFIPGADGETAFDVFKALAVYRLVCAGFYAVCQTIIKQCYGQYFRSIKQEFVCSYWAIKHKPLYQAERNEWKMRIIVPMLQEKLGVEYVVDRLLLYIVGTEQLERYMKWFPDILTISNLTKRFESVKEDVREHVARDILLANGTLENISDMTPAFATYVTRNRETLGVTTDALLYKTESTLDINVAKAIIGEVTITRPLHLARRAWGVRGFHEIILATLFNNEDGVSIYHALPDLLTTYRIGDAETLVGRLMTGRLAKASVCGMKWMRFMLSVSWDDPDDGERILTSPHMSARYTLFRVHSNVVALKCLFDDMTGKMRSIRDEFQLFQAILEQVHEYGEKEHYRVNWQRDHMLGVIASMVSSKRPLCARCLLDPVFHT